MLLFTGIIVFFILVTLSNQVVDIIQDYSCLWILALQHSTYALALTQFFELIDNLKTFAVTFPLLFAFISRLGIR
jgi:hypothetical protein